MSPSLKTAADPASQGLSLAAGSPFALGSIPLEQILQQADQSALNIKAAQARLERAEGELAEARAPIFPMVAVSAQGAVAQERHADTVKEKALPSLDASYEIDLFSRIGHARAAALANLAGANADLASERLAIAAETARVFISLKAASTNANRFEESAARARHMRDLSQLLHRAGLVGEDELRVADLDILKKQDAHEEAVLQVEHLRRALGDLTGSGSESAALGSLDQFSPITPSPIASNLVLDRPDVRAAFARSKAADERFAAATAATMPSFAITAALGGADPSFLSLLDAKSVIWTLAGTVTQTLFEGGARRARAAQADADAHLADIAYRQTVMRAWTESRDALSVLQLCDHHLATATQARSDAARALLHVRSRRELGFASEIDLLHAQDALTTAEVAFDGARSDTLEASIALISALGGQYPSLERGAAAP